MEQGRLYYTAPGTATASMEQAVFLADTSTAVKTGEA